MFEPRLIVSGMPLINPYAGQGVYTLRLIRALLNHANFNFAVATSPDIIPVADLPGEKIILLPNARTPKLPLLRNIFWSERLLRRVTKKFPDAIFHSPGPIVGTSRPRCTVVTLHDCIYRSFPRYKGRLLLRKAYLRATEHFARNSSMVMTVSEFSKKELAIQAGIPADHIHVLYPWAGSEFFLSTAAADVAFVKQKYRLPERFWVYLGGYDYRKNIEFLLRSYAAANTERRLPPLALAGQIPPTTPTTCDVAGVLKSINLPTQILLPGLIPERDLPLLYRAASLLIFPSLMEGFGLPPVEAMAAGTPVLVSDSSSLPEVVAEPACRFDPREQESLIAKLLLAAENEAQFKADLNPLFTESSGVGRYLELLDTIAC